MLVIIKDKLTDSWGNSLLQNDVINTFCEIRLYLGGADERIESRGDRDADLLRPTVGLCLGPYGGPKKVSDF